MGCAKPDEPIDTPFVTTTGRRLRGLYAARSVHGLLLARLLQLGHQSVCLRALLQGLSVRVSPPAALRPTLRQQLDYRGAGERAAPAGTGASHAQRVRHRRRPLLGRQSSLTDSDSCDKFTPGCRSPLSAVMC